MSLRNCWALLCILSTSTIAIPAMAEGHSTFRQGSWPFCPLQRPEVPAADEGWAVNAIDRFVLDRLQARGLTPSPAAEKLSLLRRVTYDLTGLPPTVAEQEAFLADTSDGAYERVVDRLLASPRFGERWAQHWLDLVRYAETDGFKSDRLKKHAWRYRDYVIRAFNEDLPYDRFVRQQLAGDELEPGHPDALVATGFLRLGPDEDNAANLHQRRQEILDEITDTTSLALLGLTIGCAQCHDHKYDDIPQTDYYRWQAFFAALTERDDALAASPTETEAYEQGLRAWEAATADVRRRIEELLSPERDKIAKTSLEKYEASIQDCYLTAADQRTPEQQRIADMVARRMAFTFEESMPSKLDEDRRAQYKELQEELASFAALRPAEPPRAMAVADLGPHAPVTHLLEGGSLARPLQPVEPGFPELLSSAEPSEYSASVATNSTGRRSQLALWLTRPDHPLTARVIVNRLWQHHFGEGIVATPNDFGFQGGNPSHPELLDWLAAELVGNGWRLKHIHRLIVLSATYRQSSLVDPAESAARRALDVDDGNRLLWRARRQRLSGEAIRDAMLAVSGSLNPRMYGESAKPELPEGVSARYAWAPDDAEADRHRRSVYVFAKRNLRFPMFEAFDQPDLNQSCARRPTTVTAPQSLLMLNGKFTRQMAEAWADRLMSDVAEDSALVVRAYREAYGRSPLAEEIQAATAFIASQCELSGGREVASIDARDPRRMAIVDFCHAIFNSNEFLSID